MKHQGIDFRNTTHNVQPYRIGPLKTLSTFMLWTCRFPRFPQPNQSSVVCIKFRPKMFALNCDHIQYVFALHPFLITVIPVTEHYRPEIEKRQSMNSHCLQSIMFCVPTIQFVIHWESYLLSFIVIIKKNNHSELFGFLFWENQYLFCSLSPSPFCFFSDSVTQFLVGLLLPVVQTDELIFRHELQQNFRELLCWVAQFSLGAVRWIMRPSRVWPRGFQANCLHHTSIQNLLLLVPLLPSGIKTNIFSSS